MLFRKIQKRIEDHFKGGDKRILVVDGARQVGKSFIVRHVCQQMFENYIEINMQEDADSQRIFDNVHTTTDFYLNVSMIAGDRLGDATNTIVFLDEIQVYPHLFSMLKFLRQEGRFTYIVSGSQLGITLSKTTSIPMGSITVARMYPLDFEEFLIANGFGALAIDSIRQKFKARESLSEAVHTRVMDLFRKYLLVGGLPDAVNAFIETTNIVKVRAVQSETHDYYGIDASKYDAANKLKIRRVYDMIPSSLENRKKRIVVKNIEGRQGKRFSDYSDEFDYLVHSGIALEVKAISNPKFPLIESSAKNLLKLYLNDVGILTGILYQNNIMAVLGDEASINLGTVYENVVASELCAHGNAMYYYDNKSHGEVDFLIDDYDNLSVLPIEVKSGKDYTVHSALNNLLSNAEYHVKSALVLSNAREVTTDGNITYMPIYYIMFVGTC